MSTHIASYSHRLQSTSELNGLISCSPVFSQFQDCSWFCTFHTVCCLVSFSLLHFLSLFLSWSLKAFINLVLLIELRNRLSMKWSDYFIRLFSWSCIIFYLVSPRILVIIFRDNFYMIILVDPSTLKVLRVLNPWNFIIVSAIIFWISVS